MEDLETVRAPERPRLLILAASARAAAQSADRAGRYQLRAADQFVDLDLAHLCPARRIEIDRAERELSDWWTEVDAWVFGGALENRPDLVETLTRRATLWGNDADVLRRVRNPLRLQHTLQQNGLPHLAVWTSTCSSMPSSVSQWLIKPIRSAAGRRIALRADNVTRPTHDTYFQQFVAGTSYGGVFLANGSDAVLVGVTQQWLGETRFGAPTRFAYVGSLGPVSLSPTQRDHWCAIGQCLTSAFGLRGLFGVDAIVTRDEIYVVEVNPRFTASMELFERAGFPSLMAWHEEACVRDQLPDSLPAVQSTHGKAILYARRAGIVSESFSRSLAAQNANGDRAIVADLPVVGGALQPGWPIVTLLADGDDVQDVCQRLLQLAERLYSSLYG